MLGAAAESAQAQQRIVLEVPRKYSLRFSDIYLQTDVQADCETQETGNPSISVTRQQIIVEPVLGLGLAGWAYHPNLLEYATQVELGLGYQNSSVSPGASGSDTQFLQRYHFAMDLLKQKPYATSLFADKDLTFRNYDFFSYVRVDSQRFGARSGYAAGAVPFSASFQHYDEEVLDLTRLTSLTEDTFNLNASNERRSGRATTGFSYNLDRFSRLEAGDNNQQGLSQNLNVIDSENFGDRNWIRLTSLLNYNSVTETAAPSEKLLLQEQLQLQHTHRLRSVYDYAFSLASASGSDSSTHEGRVGLSHQLFDNLTSTLDVHGNLTQASAPGSSLDATRYGVSLSEQYSRSLGSWGNLSLGYSGAVDHEQRTATGAQLPISREPHTLNGYDWTPLNQLSVVEVRSVTDTNGIGYTQDVDYFVRNLGGITEIRRKETTTTIPNKSVVLVDYTIALDPSGQYTSFANGANFRLDFGKGLFGIYGRWNLLDYAGGDKLQLRRMDDKLIGADSTWRWLRVGAEYEVADSNFAPYDRTRCFQSAQFRPSESTTLGLDLDETWTAFRNPTTRQSALGLIARWQQRLTSRLAWSVEGGLRRERGDTFDGDYASARTELNWAVAKLTVKLGYDYGNESHPTDFRARHFVYLRARRSF